MDKTRVLIIISISFFLLLCSFASWDIVLNWSESAIPTLGAIWVTGIVGGLVLIVSFWDD